MGKNIKISCKVVGMMFQAAPVYFLITLLTGILAGVSLGALTVVKQYFFDDAASFAAGGMAYKGLLLSMLYFGLMYIAYQVLNALENFMPTVLAEKCQGRLSCKIHEKIARLAPVDFENPEKLDAINKAEKGKENATHFAMIILMLFTSYLPYFIFMGVYLFKLKPILAAVVLLVFVPVLFSQLIRAKAYAGLEDELAPLRRETEYYEKCIVSREYFKETRLLGGFRYFKRLYQDGLKNLGQLSMKLNIRVNLIELFIKIITILGYAGILWLLFDALMKEDISVGAFAAVFSSIGMFYQMMEEVVCKHMGNMADNVGTVANYLKFLEFKERGGTDTDISVRCDISLEQVSFSYPGAQQNAVTDVTFSVNQGETIAIVGENGSGKSTLLRLITGIYTPDSGRIRYGEKEIAGISMERIVKGISAVFQKYNRYQMTLRENIAISDTEKKCSDGELPRVSRMAGFTSEEECFPQGYDTMLSREFDGVDLSGGQWQRVAIARGFYKEHDMILLDEPTAAIDPFEEARIYHQFAELSKGKTAFIVTHRLGSVKFADRIVVLKSGKVAEIGTCQELLDRGGVFAGMYAAQEQWYANS